MSFFGSLFGSDQAKDISKANKTANADLAQGYGASQGYYNQAAGSFDPYVQQGGAANTFYGNALGLNGADARTAAESTITSDPLFTGALALQNGNTQAAMNARGSGAGGAFIQAAQNNLYQNYNNALDRYANLGAQGFQATGAKANVLTGQGDNAYGYGASKANHNTGINNVLGILGTGISGYNALYNKGGGSGYARAV